MNRQKINLLVDISLGVTFLIAFVSAFAGRDYREVHEFSGIMSGVLALFHVLLHWGFIKASLKNMFR